MAIEYKREHCRNSTNPAAIAPAEIELTGYLSHWVGRFGTIPSTSLFNAHSPNIWIANLVDRLLMLRRMVYLQRKSSLPSAQPRHGRRIQSANLSPVPRTLTWAKFRSPPHVEQREAMEDFETSASEGTPSLMIQTSSFFVFINGSVVDNSLKIV